MKSVTFRTVKLDSFCIVSTPIIEKVLIPPEGCKFVAETDKRIQIDFPPGTVEKEESMSVHVRIQVFTSFSSYNYIKT